MDLSPSKQSTAKRLSLLYLVFLAGVAFLSVDIWSRQLASSVQVPVHRLQQRRCETGDSAPEQNGSVMLYVVTPTYTRYTAISPGHTDLLLTLQLVEAGAGGRADAAGPDADAGASPHLDCGGGQQARHRQAQEDPGEIQYIEHCTHSR